MSQRAKGSDHDPDVGPDAHDDVETAKRGGRARRGPIAEPVQRRSGGGVERKRNIPVWRATFLVLGVAFVALLVREFQTLPDPLPASAEEPLPARGAPIDTALARAGRELYGYRCLACHRDVRREDAAAVGPRLAGVTQRRPWPWIERMVMNPDSMLRADSIARALLLEYRVPMRNMDLTHPQFRAIFEYMRSRDQQLAAERAAAQAREDSIRAATGVPSDVR